MRTASSRGRGGSTPNRRGVSPLTTQRQNFFSAVSNRCWYSGSAQIVSSTHLPPPVMIDSTADLASDTHILCCSCAMCFSAAASSENAHGSMNLASNTAPPGSTSPSRVAAIHLMTGCWIRRCTSLIARPVLRSYQRRLSSSVTVPSWTIRFSDRSSGPTPPRFSPPPNQRSLVVAHDDAGVRSAEERPTVICGWSWHLKPPYVSIKSIYGYKG